MSKAINCISVLVSLGIMTAYAADGKLTALEATPKNFGKYQNELRAPVAFKLTPDAPSDLAASNFLLSESVRKLDLKPDVFPKTRGVKDAALFKAVAPSVVLIVADESLGSGSVINSSGEVLTNWHVVGNNKEVGVIFKPEKDTQKISKNDVYRAVVVKVDQVTDLALLKVIDFPKGRMPVKIGDISEISIGSDVHAIGHPRGEAWTYTKGVISQYRNDYQWSGGENQIRHKASVIQTQTPINPGNSGGPLVSDSGRLIGVNSFKSGDSEGLNFAVSIDDVRDFLSRGSSRVVLNQTGKVEKKCEWRTVYEGKTDDKSGEMIAYDTQCSGKTDLEVVTPFDKSRPYFLRADRNLDGKVDMLVLSTDRNDKWSISYWDNDFDGKWDSVGFHPDGSLKPARFEDYRAYSQRVAKK
jgi:S1-C subfamily serine protease